MRTNFLPRRPQRHRSRDRHRNYGWSGGRGGRAVRRVFLYVKNHLPSLLFERRNTGGNEALNSATLLPSRPPCLRPPPFYFCRLVPLYQSPPFAPIILTSPFVPPFRPRLIQREPFLIFFNSLDFSFFPAARRSPPVPRYLQFILFFLFRNRNLPSEESLFTSPVTCRGRKI